MPQTADRRRSRLGQRVGADRRRDRSYGQRCARQHQRDEPCADPAATRRDQHWGPAGASGGQRDAGLRRQHHVQAPSRPTPAPSTRARQRQAARAARSRIDGVDRNIASSDDLRCPCPDLGLRRQQRRQRRARRGPTARSATAGLLSVPSGGHHLQRRRRRTRGLGATAGSVRAEGTTVSIGGISAMGMANGSRRHRRRHRVERRAERSPVTVNTFGGGGNAGGPGGAGRVR